MKLLLMEDDTKLSQHLSESLGRQGFLVSPLGTKDELLERLRSPARYEVIVMDRLLGPSDSKAYLADIRQKWPSAALIVLSAINTPNERAEALDLGADDYLGKPFSTKELTARIRALLRRTSAPPENYLRVGNVILDSMRRLVSVDTRSETFPNREFALLRALAAEPAKVWSRAELLDSVWAQNLDIETNVVESTVANLRRRLNDLGADISIRNLRNTGYWIET